MVRLIFALSFLMLCGCSTEEFEDVISSEGKFRVKMPKGYKIEQIKFQEMSGKDIIIFDYKYASRDRLYNVSFSETEPSQEQSEKKKKERLLISQQSTLASNKAALIGEPKQIRLDNAYEGIEYVSKDSKQMRRCRTYLVNDKVYQLVVMGDEAFIKSELAEEFFNSFQLLK